MKLELLSKDEWVEWFEMPQTRQILKDLDTLKENKLYSSVIHLSQGNDTVAKIDAGAVLCLEEINNILKSYKHQREQENVSE